MARQQSKGFARQPVSGPPDTHELMEIVNYTAGLPPGEALSNNPTSDQLADFQNLRGYYAALAKNLDAYYTGQPPPQIECDDPIRLRHILRIYTTLYDVIWSGWEAIQAALLDFLERCSAPELFDDFCSTPGGVLRLCLLEDSYEDVKRTQGYSEFSPRKYIPLHLEVIDDVKRLKGKPPKPGTPEAQRRKQLNTLELTRSPEPIGRIRDQICKAARKAARKRSGRPPGLDAALQNHATAVDEASASLRKLATHRQGKKA